MTRLSRRSACLLLALAPLATPAWRHAPVVADALLLRVVDDDGDAAQSAHRALWSAGRVDGFLVLDLERGDRRLATPPEGRIPVLAGGVPDPDDPPWAHVLGDPRPGTNDYEMAHTAGAPTAKKRWTCSGPPPDRAPAS